MPGDYSNSNHTAVWLEEPETQGSEIILDGIGSVIELANSSDWVFTGDFTVEAFGVKFANTANRHPVVSFWRSTTGERSWMLDWNPGTPNLLRFILSNDGTNSTIISHEFTPTVDQAYDIAFDRSGSDCRLYLDGSMVADDTHSGALNSSSAPLAIGSSLSGAGNYFSVMEGRLRTIRITKGTARYADDGGYTVPDLPLPTEGPA